MNRGQIGLPFALQLFPALLLDFGDLQQLIDLPAVRGRNRVNSLRKAVQVCLGARRLLT